MGLLEDIIGGLSAQPEPGGVPGPGAQPAQAGAGGIGAIMDMIARNPQIIVAALALLNPKEASVGGGRGLGEVIGGLQGGGLGDIVSSWVGAGANQPISPGQLASVLGDDALGQFARKAGIGAHEAGPVLAAVLPMLVDRLTPQGQVPDARGLESALGGLLGSLGR